MAVNTEKSAKIVDSVEFQNMLSASRLPEHEATSLPAACYHETEVQESEIENQYCTYLEQVDYAIYARCSENNYLTRFFGRV